MTAATHDEWVVISSSDDSLGLEAGNTDLLRSCNELDDIADDHILGTLCYYCESAFRALLPVVVVSLFHRRVTAELRQSTAPYILIQLLIVFARPRPRYARELVTDGVAGGVSRILSFLIPLGNKLGKKKEDCIDRFLSVPGQNDTNLY